MSTIIQVTRRAVGGAPGAPAALKSGQIAYNMQDGYLYVGYGDNGAGMATSVKPFARHDFNAARLLTMGGTVGQILTKKSGDDYDVEWRDAPQNYTEGSGISIAAGVISANATIARLASPTFTGTVSAPTPAGGDNSTKVATTAFVTSALTPYATLASPNFTGTPTAPTPAAGDNTTKIATTAFVYAGLGTKANTVHTHDGADITTGTIDIARLPAALFQAPIISSGSIANLTAAQQDEIRAGTSVVTTDGREWRYTGTGSKTQEASYVELGDRTPDWSVIANKPVFSTVATSGQYNDLLGKPVLAPVATSGSYNDLLDKPTLGTIASQNANNVNITGGTIDGVTLDGGTF